MYIDEANLFLGGATMVACWTVALFFAKFWRRTGDQLFGCFALAFLFLGIERIILSYMRTQPEMSSPAVYLIRLAAFLLLIWAIIKKNLAEKK